MSIHLSMPDVVLPALVLVAAASLILTAALHAAILYVNRARLHVYANRFGVAVESLHRSVSERNRLIAALEVARVAAYGVTLTIALYVAITRFQLNAADTAVTALLVCCVLMLLEAIPRVVVRENPERWGFMLAPVATAYALLFGWIGWLFDLPGRFLLRFGGAAAPDTNGHEQEELLRLVEIEESSGGIEEEERQMIRGVIGLEDTMVREIMVPRLDMATVGTQETIEDAVRLIVARGYSRLPLYEGSIDNIVGIVYAKDLLRSLIAKEQQPTLRGLSRPAYVVPETKRVDELLRELRHNKVHIAIVVDEFGGTAGLATIEDLLEEIVGEIEDEYDRGEPTIERIDEDEAIVDARIGIEALDELFGVDVEDPEVDTVGGFVYNHLAKIPVPGDALSADGLTITVLSVTGHRIKKLRIRRAVAQATAPKDGVS